MKKTVPVNRIAYSKTSRVLLFVSLGAFITLSLWFYQQLNQSQRQRYLSYVAADELRQSSDDLTRMVRTYVMTTDLRYEEMYWDILAIRNGQKARPIRYENIYWDFIAFSDEKPRPDGQTISLLEMMKELGFTQEELAKLAHAETHSNALVRIEEIAMHAMKGEFLDTQGEFTIKSEPDHNHARTILYDESYHRAKVDIMMPIDEVFVMVNARTEAKVNRDTIATYISISLVFATIFLLLCLSRIELNEYKRTETALQEASGFRETIFSESPIGITIYDAESGQCVAANKAIAKAIGARKEQVLAQNINDIPSWQTSGLLETAKSALNDDANKQQEVTLTTTFGKRITADCRFTPFSAGDEKYLQLTLADITERKRAQEDFQDIVETSVDGFYVINLETGLRFTHVNDAFCEIEGYSREELLNMGISDLEVNENLEDISRHAEKIIEIGFDRFETKHRRKDGDIIDVAITIKKDKESKRFIAFVRDITERIQAEQEIADNRAQLKSLASELVLAEERERNRIAVHLHDDVCQNLAYVKMRIQMVSGALDDPIQIDNMRNASDTLTRMMHELRTLTFELSPPILAEFGLEAAISHWLLEQIESKHGIATAFIDDGQTKSLTEDIRALLFRSVRELLVNVVKHSEAQRVEVSVSREGDQIQIRLEDNGIGFDPDKVVVGHETGGFGLFSIRERLSHIGGILEIDSSPGQGCRSFLRASLQTS